MNQVLFTHHKVPPETQYLYHPDYSQTNLDTVFFSKNTRPGLRFLPEFNLLCYLTS